MVTHPLQIGLTGGIGSGKSTVAAMLVAHGAVLIDTDAISRSLTRPGGLAIEPLRAAFGDDLIAPDGAMDRARMREHVFADPTAKARLEGILHPLIGLECNRQADAAGDAVRVFDVPLLVESARWRARVDRVLVVDCREEVQVARVLARSAWARDTVLAVIGQQASRAARRAAADAVIFNDGIGLEELAAEVASLWQRWCPVEQWR
ncbi:dephospho-CoA kinase [Rhizobacter sp. Root1221]|uniref:dephospho-CoA kinase n=1 Tax=Rhizobacter sp. Root1221 TaxID=1736433 RepID=UPI000AB03C7E